MRAIVKEFSAIQWKLQWRILVYVIVGVVCILTF